MDAGVVRYYRNDTLIYTSTRPPTYPLRVHASIVDMHGTVKDVMLTAAATAPPVKYGWVPPAQTVGGGITTRTVPAGYIHTDGVVAERQPRHPRRLHATEQRLAVHGLAVGGHHAVQCHPTGHRPRRRPRLPH